MEAFVTSVKSGPDTAKQLSIIIKSSVINLYGPWHFEEDAGKEAGEVDAKVAGFDHLVVLDGNNHLIHPADHPYIHRMLEIMGSGKSIDYHFKVVAPSGEVKQVHGYGNLSRPVSPTKNIVDDFEGQIAENELQLKVFKYSEHVAQIGCYCWDIKKDVLHVSDNLYRIFGVSLHSLAATWDAFMQFIEPDDAQRVRSAYANGSWGTEPMILKYKIRRPDGKIRHVCSRSEVFKTSTGHQYLIGTIQDVTHQTNSEASLEESRDLLQAVFDGSAIGLTLLKAIYNAEGDVVDFEYVLINSIAMAGGLQRTGHRFNEIHGEAGTMLFDFYRQVMSTATVAEFEDVIHVGGAKRWYHITAQRVGDLLIATSEDISGKKQTQHELLRSRDSLQKQKALLQKCLDAMPQLVWVSDAMGNINFFNDRWYEYTGVIHQESRSYNYLSTSMVHPSQVKETLTKWQQCLNEGTPYSGETLLRDAAGNYRWHLELIVPIKDEQGSIQMWIGTLTDVHEQFVNEKRLKESAHLLETVFNAFASAVQVFDCVYDESNDVIDFRWRYVNTKTREYAGRDDLIGQRISKVYPDIVSSGVLNRMKEVCRTGKTRELEIPFAVNGSPRWFHTVVVKIEDGLVVNNLDISDRKAAQERIFLQHRLDRQVARIANTGNWEWNMRTDQVTCGDNLYALLELDRMSSRATLDDFIKAIHPDDLAVIREASETAREIGEGPFPSIEFRVMKKDGGVRYLRSASEIVKRDDQRFAIGTIRDVTDEIQMREALAERMRFTEAIVEFSVDRILAFDTSLRCLAWNKKCEVFYGISKEDILGKVITEVFPAFVERDEFMNNIRRVLQGEVVYTPQVEGIYHAGYYEAFLVPLKDERNEVYGAVATLHDLTEKVKAQQELEMLNESLNKKNFELKVMNEELASFAFIASHDLREPLRKIHVFSEALANSEANNLSAGGKNYFNRILNAVQRMNGLIDNILAFSRISSENRKVELFDLNEAMAMAKVELDILIREKNAHIECEGLPFFKGDQQQVVKLLVNLIGNALKFQKQGNIPVVKVTADYVLGSTIDHPSVIPQKKYLQMTVADNGIGFEQVYAGKIFKMFQRLHGMFEFPGNGMGLAICKKVVDNHQGFIITEGSPGVGAVFNCYFPLID